MYNLTKAKQELKDEGVYHLIYLLCDNTLSWGDKDNIKEIVYRVLDNIPSDLLRKAENIAKR